MKPLRTGRDRGRIGAIGLGILAAAGACGGEGSPARSNLILISLDTCRADRLSCYGYERETSPELDRFALEALRFEDCLAQSSSTGPSHMSIMTGQYAHRHGLLNNANTRIPQYTLASLLRDAGWRTAAFTGHGSLQGRFGHSVGFELFRSWSEGSPPKSRYMRLLDEVLPEGIAWLEDATEPFFLFLHGYDPHCPYWPPEDLRSQLEGAYGGALELEDACFETDFAWLFQEGRDAAEDLRHLNAMYDAEIRSADRALGEFLGRLRGMGLLDSSIVVFTSDHGELLGEHQRVGHTTQWEPEIQVPLLIRFPSGRWRGESGEPVMHIDLVPTLLSALGVAPPDGLQGVDLMPVIRGERTIGRERMRMSEKSSLRSVRFDDRWKIIWGVSPLTKEKEAGLYDLTRDPDEKVNLFQTPSGRKRFLALYERVSEWLYAHMEDDQRFRAATPAGVEQQGDVEMLRALGYAEDVGR